MTSPIQNNQPWGMLITAYVYFEVSGFSRSTLVEQGEPFLWQKSLKENWGSCDLWRKWTKKHDNTVDGQNPAPPRMMNIPLFIGFLPSQVVQDFFHQQYDMHYMPVFHSHLFSQRIRSRYWNSVMAAFELYVYYIHVLQIGCNQAIYFCNLL